MYIARESIFSSSLRALCKVFAVIVGIGLGLFVIFWGLGKISPPISPPDQVELTLDADANGDRTLLPPTSPVLLRINVHGIIGSQKINEESFSNMLLSSREGILGRDRVKGILLHMNTPGGLSTTSNTIYRLIKNYKAKYQVPVYVYVEGLCASGGMYVASAADQIFSSEDSVIGSVGVRLGPLFNFSQTLQKWGVDAVTLTEGKDKDAFNSFRPWKEGEGSALKNIIEEEYNQFVNIVVSGRPKITKEALQNEYGAQVFLSPKAEEIGFVDHGQADYEEAVTALAKASGIEGKYQVVLMEPPQSILKNLFLDNSGTGSWMRFIPYFSQLDPHASPDMKGRLLYLYEPY